MNRSHKSLSSPNDALARRIRPVTRRLRTLRFWRTWTLVALVLAGIGVCLKAVLPSDASLYAILASGVTALVGILIWTRLSFRDVGGVAKRIENRFPSLAQRLLTAVDQRGDDLGYLQHRVIREARDHSRANSWTDVVSRAKLFWSRLTGFASTALLGLVLASISVSETDLQSTASIANLPVIKGVQVTPGNTEVERGSAVIVTARFGDDFDASTIPSEGELVCKFADGTSMTLPMRRNLGDPVLAAMLPSADAPLDYQIVTPSWQSETYHMGVFDFPALIRSDADLAYPSYTAIADKTIQDTVRITAIRGTRVTWTCLVNKPLVTAEFIETESELVVPMTLDDTSATVTMTLENSSSYRLRLVDDQSRENKLEYRFKMKVLDNGQPKIEMMAGGDASVSPLQEFLVRAELKDDFAVVAAGLSYTLGADPPVDVTFDSDVANQPTRERIVETTIDLESLQAEEDELLTYYLWAEDEWSETGEPDAQRRRIQGDIFFAEVRPFEQTFRKGDPPPGGESPPSQNEQDAGELAELQKEVISATWKLIGRTSREKDSPEFAADVAVVAQAQRDALTMLEELQQKLKDPQSRAIADQVGIDMTAAAERLDAAELEPAQTSEQAAYGGLLKLRSREFQVTKQKQPSQGSPGKRKKNQKQLDELELEQDENRYETQSQAKKSAEQTQQRQDRQIMNRLKELARRQTDLNRVLAELQSAIRKAETDEEREEIERRLKRLREQQQDMLRDMDELAERMQETSNDENRESSAADLEKAREDVRRAGEAIQNKDPSSALAAGAKAGERLENLRDEMREATSGQFDAGLRDMQQQAAELEQEQERIAEELAEDGDQQNQAGLRTGDAPDEVSKKLEDQAERLRELTDDMQDMVEQAEAGEPLLADKLYEGFKAVQKQQVQTRLDQAGKLNRLGFSPQARQAEALAREGIGQLKKAIDESAESVLGSSEKALQEALSTLEQLEKQVANSEGEQGEPSESKGKGKGSGSQSEQPAKGKGKAGSLMNSFAAESESSAASPVTGDGFREFSDSLRDVEEMVDRPELKSRAAQIRDRTREMRVDYTRNSKPPEPEAMEELIASPLRELKRDVAEELMRRSAEKNVLVPIDRDPVPRQFSRSLEVYYQRLGSEKLGAEQ